jgi:hypothetical protein
MKKLFSILLVIVFAACETPSNYVQPSYEEVKMTLEEQERMNPIAFLSDKSTYRKNLIGEWVIEGKISNAATIATYKDAILQITYYSGTDTEMGSENTTIYEFFRPGSVQPFKIKTFGPKGAKAVSVSVISAVSTN